MNPPTDQSVELDYLLGVGSATAPTTAPSDLIPPVASVPPVQLPTAVTSVVPSGSANPNDVAPTPDVAALAVPASEHSAATTSTPSSANPNSADMQPNSKKRPLEDKKARDRKRVLRNRELARVSNERRKGRIKAMENELNETRQTVSTLEESIRCLEAENQELRNLLQGKPEGAAPGATPPVAPQ